LQFTYPMFTVYYFSVFSSTKTVLPKTVYYKSEITVTVIYL
jgi:hypothetical protein